MKKVKMILPMLAFLFALAASFVSVKADTKRDLLVTGRWTIDCEQDQFDCNGGEFTCRVGTEVIYQDNTPTLCSVPLKQSTPN